MKVDLWIHLLMEHLSRALITCRYANIVAKTYPANTPKTHFNKTLDACKFTRQLSGIFCLNHYLETLKKVPTLECYVCKKGYYEIQQRKFKILIVPVVFGKVKFSVKFSVLSKISVIITNFFHAK